jgi:hypothetical protein
MSDVETQRNGQSLTDYRISMIEDTLQVMSDNLQRLTALEQRHFDTRNSLDRAFETIEKVDVRLKDVELEMPVLRIVKNWVIAAVIGIVGLVGIALFTLLTK